MAMENKPYVIGLDLGGTNSVFGIVNSEGSVVTSTSIRTKGQNDLDVYMDSACAALAPMIEQVGGIQNIKGNWHPTCRGKESSRLQRNSVNDWGFPWS